MDDEIPFAIRDQLALPPDKMPDQGGQIVGADDCDRPPDIAYLDDVRKSEPPKDLQDRPRIELALPAIISASELFTRDIPPRKWVVPNLIPERNVTLLYGDGGTGKSLLSLQLAASLAAGAPWLGMDLPNPGPALFVTAEDEENEVARRTMELAEEARWSARDLSALKICSLAGHDAMMANLVGNSFTPTGIFKQIEGRVNEFGTRLLIIDTLSDVYPGNENDRAQARGFISLLRGMALRSDVAVMVLAHPSESGLQSGTGKAGSTAWNNTVRSRMYLTRIEKKGREPDPDARALILKKSNYARAGGVLATRVGRGGFKLAAPGSATSKNSASLSKARDEFMRLLQQCDSEGRHVNGNSGPNYAPSFFAKDPSTTISRNGFRQAMGLLFETGEIENLAGVRGSRIGEVLQ